MSLAIAIHVLAAAVWLGGMFFAYQSLRPELVGLGADLRLSFWRRTLGRFFAWAWLSMAALLLSGFAMLFLAYGGAALVPPYVRVMMALGVLATLAYAYVYVMPWRRFRSAVLTADWPTAERKLRHVRFAIAAMFVLTAAAAVIGAGGRYVG